MWQNEKETCLDIIILTKENIHFCHNILNLAKVLWMNIKRIING